MTHAQADLLGKLRVAAGTSNPHDDLTLALAALDKALERAEVAERDRDEAERRLAVAMLELQAYR